MPGSSPGLRGSMLRDRLAALNIVGRMRQEPVRPAMPWDRGARNRDGAPFEIRRSVRSVREIFGREKPHPSDAGALFLDTETTGLAGGTGTTPFLIGLATVERNEVTLEQYFLRLGEQGDDVRTNFSDLPDEEIIALSWWAVNELGAQNTVRHPHTGEVQERTRAVRGATRADV